MILDKYGEIIYMYIIDIKEHCLGNLDSSVLSSSSNLSYEYK